MRFLACLMLLLSPAAHAEPGTFDCPNVEGTWTCDTMGPMPFTVTQAKVEQGLTQLSLSMPVGNPITLKEYEVWASSLQIGALKSARFYCNFGKIKASLVGAQIAQPDQVPAELLKGDVLPAGPTTIWSEIAVTVETQGEGELTIDGTMKMVATDAALKSERSAPVYARCRRQ